MNGDPTLEGRIAKAKERATSEMDQRVLRDMDLAAAFPDEGRTSARARRRLAPVLAAALVVIAVLGGTIALVVHQLGREREDVDLARTTPPPQPNLPESDPAVATSHDVERRPEERKRDPVPPEAQPPSDEPLTAEEIATFASIPAEQDEPVRERKSPGHDSELGVFETFRYADLVVRMKPIGRPSRDRPNDRNWSDGRRQAVQVEITAVYHGDAAFHGATARLLPGTDARRRSFLARDERAAEHFWKEGSEFVACVEPVTPDGARPGAAPLFRVALGEGYAVTLVAAADARAGAGPNMNGLLLDLARSLADPSSTVRESAITALRHADRRDFDRARSVVWKNLDLRGPLMAAVADSSPLVRWQVASLDPGEVCTEVGNLAPLFELLFDPVPAVRDAALLALLRLPDNGVAPPRWELRDDRFVLSRSRMIEALRFHLAYDRGVERAIDALRTHRDATTRADYAEALVAAAGRDDEVGLRARSALIDALRDADAEVRRAAADALGRFGEPSSAGALFDLRDDADHRVAVAAAGARVRLGDLGGIDALRELAVDGDRRVAFQAVVVVGELLQEERTPPAARGPLIAILPGAFRHAHAGVRGEVIVSAAFARSAFEPGEDGALSELIARGAGDESPYVQAAAAVADTLTDRVRNWRELSKEGFLPYLHGLGYVDGGEDEK